MSQSDAPSLLTSMICRRAHFDAPWYARWSTPIGAQIPAGTVSASGPDRPLFHRKNWEWAAVAQVLFERDMLQAGRCGIGFAVGREPLASLFAARGAEVLATDLGAEDDQSAQWSDTGQHAASLDALHWPNLCDRGSFDARVKFMPQDMRNLEPERLGTFDFIWSACSFEHLGDLEAGLQFVLLSTELLKPGGVAVHTTEVNLSSPDRTLATGNSVIYRLSDIDALAYRLRAIGCALEWVDPFAGTAPEDIEYDIEPFYQTGRQHIKLMLGGYVTTSLLLIIRKGRYPETLPPLRMLLAQSSEVPGSGPVLGAAAVRLATDGDVPEARTSSPRVEGRNGGLSGLEREMAQLRAELAGMRASTSWRLTGPLRMATRLLRGR